MKLPTKILALALAVVLAVSIVAPATAAQAPANPFSAIPALVDWFDQLNVTWSKIVIREERAQYLRSLDRLRAELMELEGGTQLLLAIVPNNRPDESETIQLRTGVNKLYASLARVRAAAKSVQTQIALKDSKLPKLINETTTARGVTLRFLERELNERRQPWQAAEIKARLTNALGLLSRTQVAVTRFRNKIAAQR